MIIGVDIDGVLTDLLKSVKKEYLKFAKKENGKVKINKYGKSLGEYFGLNREQDSRFFNSYIWEYSEKAIYYKSAKKYLNLLRKQGHLIYIVTARSFAGRDDGDGEKMRAIIENSLKKADIVYDKIFYTSELKNKVPVIQENNIDVFIDDSFWNIESLSPVIPVICYHQKYNVSFNVSDLMRARNWRDVYKFICKLNKTRKKI